jgi:hypothetical protein
MVIMKLIEKRSALKKFSWCIQWYKKSWKRAKTRHDKHRVDHSFQVGDEFWIYISKERVKGEGKNIKQIRYGDPDLGAEQTN